MRVEFVLLATRDRRRLISSIFPIALSRLLSTLTDFCMNVVYLEHFVELLLTFNLVVVQLPRSEHASALGGLCVCVVYKI